ncbi:MAG: RDD family protein [Saprospiraceae bacterium]|nr:RDD family protein [Saprospiraceae bacterium]
MMVLDHILFSVAGAIIMLPIWFVFIFTTLKEGGPNPTTGSEAVFGGIQVMLVLYAFIMAIYLNKDAINGRSPAKRILGARVVDMTDGQTASPMKCLLRNITLIFWPIEALLALLTSDRRRAGDYLAGTRVVMQAPDNPPAPLDWGKILLSYLAGVGLIGLLMLPVYFMMGVLEDKAKENLEMYDSSSMDDGETSDETTLASEMDASLTVMLEPALAEYMSDISVQTTEQGADNYVVDISGVALLDDLMNDDEQLDVLKKMAQKTLEEKLPEASLPVKGRIVIRSADPNSKEMRILSF